MAKKKAPVKRSKAFRKEPRDTSWWNVWPGLYKKEIGAFERKGVSYRIKLKKKGILILEADWPIQGKDNLRLSIGFSPMHPFFRPEVAAPEQTFERHQHPLNKNLCLLTQEAHQWDSRQLVADFIDERLQKFLDALEARCEERWEDAAKLEEQTADPLMPYFDGKCEMHSIILFNGQMKLPQQKFGLMDIAFRNRPYSDAGCQSFEAIIKSLKTIYGHLIETFHTELQSPSDRSVNGRWIRLDRPPLTGDSDLLLTTVEKEFSKLSILQPNALNKLKEISSESLSITGILFPEEIYYGQGRTGVGWIFIVSRRNVKKYRT